jgi:hypothetical protein
MQKGGRGMNVKIKSDSILDSFRSNICSICPQPCGHLAKASIIEHSNGSSVECTTYKELKNEPVAPEKTA